MAEQDQDVAVHYEGHFKARADDGGKMFRAPFCRTAGEVFKMSRRWTSVTCTKCLKKRFYRRGKNRTPTEVHGEAILIAVRLEYVLRQGNFDEARDMHERLAAQLKDLP